MAERLQKVLAHWGIASRRQAEAMIKAGRVTLNGHPAELGQKADPAVDQIEIDGTTIQPDRPDLTYLLLHKPTQVVSTCQDTHGRPTVIDLLPPEYQQGQGIHPVGRLDADSTGALILTNDGNLTYGLTHPRHHVPKVYTVEVEGQPSASALQSWRRGVLLDGRKTQPAQVRVVQVHPSQTQLEIVLTEGRKRQIRRVAEQLGHPVQRLHRVAIGPIHLQDLPAGQVRSLTAQEVLALKQAATIPSD